MPTDLSKATVVITGASSGIGRATALELASYGSSVVLAGRRSGALEALAQDCERRGGRAIAVPTDTADEEAVDFLARRAEEEFGGFDVWVNNASVYAVGRADEVPSEAIRRLIDVNLLGYVWGSRAALRHFRQRGRGVLIQNASVLGKGGAPYLSYYAATKHAVIGYAQSLRMELLGEKDIHVCTVMPATMDTPIFQQAANFSGRALKALNPVYEAGDAARAIVACARKPEAEVFAGNAAKAVAALRQASTTAYEQTFAMQVEADHFGDAEAPRTMGNLLEPMREYAAISGGWTVGRGQVSDQRVTRVALVGAMLLALGAGGLAWRRGRTAGS
ncbi:MAG TPA: SDR family oxidoreductase [Candidatus Limnocylindrales bacterium]|nr:SDR family oxidoreductase [Candidatus Limnocylindrales bacterium]